MNFLLYFGLQNHHRTKCNDDDVDNNNNNDEIESKLHILNCLSWTKKNTLYFATIEVRNRLISRVQGLTEEL